MDEPEPVAEPDPVDEPDPVAEPEPEPEPEPVAEPDPAPTAEADPPEDPPATEAPDIQGTWDGRWGGKPMRLIIKAQEGERVVGEIEIFVGTTYRTIPLSGRVDPATGAVRFWESGGSELTLQGSVSGKAMSGTSRSKGQRKALTWSATLTRGAY